MPFEQNHNSTGKNSEDDDLEEAIARLGEKIEARPTVSREFVTKSGALANLVRTDKTLRLFLSGPTGTAEFMIHSSSISYQATLNYDGHIVEPGPETQALIKEAQQLFTDGLLELQAPKAQITEQEELSIDEHQ